MKEHINSLKHKPITTQNNKTEKIDIRDWKEFRFGDYVKDDEIYKAKKYNKEDLTISKTDNGIPYITRTEPNNSCEFMAIKDEYEYIEKGNAIVIGDTTSTISYQEENFICGDHIVVIRPEWLNKYNGLFITTMLKQERFRYCYGRAFLMETIKNTKLLLPEKNGEPDWAYMEKYMKSLPYGDRI